MQTAATNTTTTNDGKNRKFGVLSNKAHSFMGK